VLKPPRTQKENGVAEKKRKNKHPRERRWTITAGGLIGERENPRKRKESRKGRGWWNESGR